MGYKDKTAEGIAARGNFQKGSTAKGSTAKRVVCFFVMAELLSVGFGCSSESATSGGTTQGSASSQSQSAVTQTPNQSGTNSSGSSSSSAAASQQKPAADASSAPTSNAASNFAIEGKWKNTSKVGTGQAQPGAIIVFDGSNCNFISPRDTYAFYKDGDRYILDWTTALGSSGTTIVKVIDANQFEIAVSDGVAVFKRVS